MFQIYENFILASIVTFSGGSRHSTRGGEPLSCAGSRHSARGGEQFHMFPSISSLFFLWRGPKSIVKLDGGPWLDFPLGSGYIEAHRHYVFRIKLSALCKTYICSIIVISLLISRRY